MENKNEMIVSFVFFLLYFCRADFDFFARFQDAASCINARRHASSRQLWLLACVVALWPARTCFADFGRANCALLCCVCGRCLTTTCSYIIINEEGHKKQKVWKKKPLLKKRERGRRQVIEEGVVQVGALRGQRCANGAR